MTASAALEPVGDRRVVGEVADDQLAAELLELGALRGRADERADVIASLAQLAGHMAPDEAGARR